MSTETHNAHAGKHVICLAFAVGQRVRIRAIDAVGTVYNITVSRDGIEYCVKWFNDETRLSDYFQASELEAA